VIGGESQSYFVLEVVVKCSLKPRSYSAYGLITAKARQNVISCEADKIKQVKQNDQIDYF
jgi:hypothetical protein